MKCTCCKENDTLMGVLIDPPGLYVMLCDECQEELDSLKSNEKGQYAVVVADWRGKESTEVYSNNCLNICLHFGEVLNGTVFQRIA